MIVIAGKDKDFSHTLAEQVVRELAQPCECINTLDELKRLPADDISLVVTASGDKPEGFLSLSLALPVRLRSALADISAALSQADSKEPAGIMPDFTLSERRKELTFLPSRSSVNLTDKEMQLLKALATAEEKGLAKEELLKEVWGIEADLNTHTLETHIYRLRSKFKDVSGHEMIIATDNGYKLSA